MKRLPSKTEMHRAIRTRDAEYDGIFYTAVRTTGIFCRPSCPARKPDPKNVAFYRSPREALAHGYRPCRRCRPMEPTGRPPAWVRRLFAAVEADPQRRITERALRRMGIKAGRARRYFQENYGMTFHAYQRARRLGEAFTKIREGRRLIDVEIGHGYESSSGFREAFSKTFGRSPGRSRGADCLVTTMIESPLGPLLAGATSQAVCLLEFTDRRALETQFQTIRKRFDCAVVPGDNAHLKKLRQELRSYFDGTLREFTVPLTYPGTPFQVNVWDALRRIPYGSTWSYEKLARRVGRPGAQRAVGSANGKNRIAIVIPCHRVVNKGGQLGGYGGGLWRKRFLLELEQGAAGRQVMFPSRTARTARAYDRTKLRHLPSVDEATLPWERAGRPHTATRRGRPPLARSEERSLA